MAILHKFNGEEVIATELPQLLNQNFDYVNDNRIKTVNNVEYDENNNIDVTHLVSQSIVSGTDLNNLTTSGEYVRLGSVIKLLNSPSDTPFFLTVLASNGLVKQVLTELIVNNPATFTRTMNGTQWSPWIESGANIGTWESNEQVKVGDVRYVGGRDYTGYVLECVQAGTTGDSQPTISSSDIDNSTDLEGFSGTLQIAHGGTGATTVAGARNALGLGNTTGALPIANGGTGATTAESARSNLGLTYATQAQAEAGTDNTTVMTPLRTAQEIDSKRPIKVFTSLEQLGLNNTATLEQIYNKMPDGGVANLFFNADTVSWGIPALSCGYIFTMLNDRLNIKAFNNGGNIYERVYTSWSDVGWKKLATQGALSMPSERRVKISVKSGENYYTAPADGWVIAQGSSLANAQGIIGILYPDNTIGLYDRRTNGFCMVTFPVAKGVALRIVFTNIDTPDAGFHYAQSEV